MADTSPFASLQAEIAAMLSTALSVETRHAADIERLDQAHLAETVRRDELHLHELERRDRRSESETAALREALETRDIIGQAKGIIMSTMTCSADEAFHLLRKQSQHENRKLVEVAAEIANRAGSRARRRPQDG